MSAKAGKRPLRSLTAHEKLVAIHRVHDGESKASVARDIGVPESTLRGWCKNEDKISYMSRQSSPETDEATNEHKEKRQKMDDVLQPYNLSLKTSNGFSPNSEIRYPADFPKGEADKSKTAADLSTKSDKPKSTSHMTEKEKNRAELTLLGNLIASNGVDFRSVLAMAQYYDIMMQQHPHLFQKNTQPKKISALADSSSSSSAAPAGGLLTTVKTEIEHKQKSTPKLPRTSENRLSPSDENTLYWMRTYGLLPAANLDGLPTTSPLPSTTSSAASLTNTASVNGSADAHTPWYSRFYKQTGTTTHLQAQISVPEKPILYQQLTKTKDYSNTENISISAKPEEKPRSTNPIKRRSALDNLLYCTNNNVHNDSKQTEEVFSRMEALEHGEKLLMWLETCSDEPSITKFHLMQLRSLLDNIRSGVDRKNGDAQNKTKVKRK